MCGLSDTTNSRQKKIASRDRIRQVLYYYYFYSRTDPSVSDYLFRIQDIVSSTPLTKELLETQKIRTNTAGRKHSHIDSKCFVETDIYNATSIATAKENVFVYDGRPAVISLSPRVRVGATKISLVREWAVAAYIRASVKLAPKFQKESRLDESVFFEKIFLDVENKFLKSLRILSVKKAVKKALRAIQYFEFESFILLIIATVERFWRQIKSGGEMSANAAADISLVRIFKCEASM